jgi:heat shock protein HslJ
VGEPISFDASGSSAGSSPIVSYAWNFGDGTTASPSGNSNTTTLYNYAGTFQVSVVVTDQNGLSSSATTPVTISTRMSTPSVWILDTYANQGLLPGTGIALQFQSGQIAGFAGCNSYTGGYTATPNQDGSYSVTITGIVTTSMSCPAEIMDQESKYIALLSAVTIAQLQGNSLTLISPNGNLVYHETGTLSVTPY